MKEKWVVSAKKADFQAIGQHFGIDPVLARIMRNRGLTDLQEMNLYLHGTRADLERSASVERCRSGGADSERKNKRKETDPDHWRL